MRVNRHCEQCTLIIWFAITFQLMSQWIESKDDTKQCTLANYFFSFCLFFISLFDSFSVSVLLFSIYHFSCLPKARGQRRKNKYNANDRNEMRKQHYRTKVPNRSVSVTFTDVKMTFFSVHVLPIEMQEAKKSHTYTHIHQHKHRIHQKKKCERDWNFLRCGF